jgi:hypothetical protein
MLLQGFFTNRSTLFVSTLDVRILGGTFRSQIKTLGLLTVSRPMKWNVFLRRSNASSLM